ncbi:MAG: hypothetical protein ABI895_42420, partial [Deltaproteobacteria bacterium]
RHARGRRDPIDGVRGSLTVFAFSLIRAIEARKLSLVERHKSKDDLKGTEIKELDFLRGRGAAYIYAAAIGGSLETLLARKVANKFRVSFAPKTSPKPAIGLWEPIIAATASLTVHLAPALEAGMKTEALRRALETFGSLVEATTQFNDAIYSAFRTKVMVS